MYRDGAMYDEIVNMIIDIYIDYDIRGFPIDEKVICRKLGVSLVPYTEFSQETKKLLFKRSRYGFFVKGTKENPPTIYYNDKFGSRGAIRFTIFHELKHYVCDEDSGNEETDDLADYFAKFFMCPIPYLILKGVNTINAVIAMCEVSEDAAINVVSNIQNREKTYGKAFFPYEVPLLEHLDKDAYIFSCDLLEDKNGGDA